MKEFNIRLSDKLSENKFFDEPTAIDISKLEFAVLRFSTKYAQTEWKIVLGDADERIPLRGLIQIWSDIPTEMSKINSMNGEGKLDFFEPGYEKVVVMKSISKKDVEFRFVSYRASNDVDLISPTVIKKSALLTEWSCFINQIINLLIKLELIAASDDSVKSYLASMPKID
ncbi:MAG: hypothetical protein ACFE0Q_09125 [Anaerolineae bacterium]